MAHLLSPLCPILVSIAAASTKEDLIFPQVRN